MKTSLSNTSFEDRSIPPMVVLPSLKPASAAEGQAENMHPIHVLNLTECLPVPSPPPDEQCLVLDVDRMAVSASLMRKIGHELKNDECDHRTVFNYCRGLERNSIEFEIAYTTARIRSFEKHQRRAADPLLGGRIKDASSLQDPCLNEVDRSAPMVHPMAVNKIGHLMRHFGVWVCILVAIQFWASWRVGEVSDIYLKGGRFLYCGIAILLMMLLDVAVWLRQRGKFCEAFLIPGVLLFVMALLLIFGFHVREIMVAKY